jgi:phosphatidylserine/phosphatidylglycerophosphate/cardiolipin synthase-like enzyme
MKKSALFLVSTLTLASTLQAATLKERDPGVYNYDVLFTNPTCSKHEYPKAVETQSGEFIKYTKENVFCSRGDRSQTAGRDGSDTRMGKNESPQYRLLKLINAKSTKSIFMTYLSFSDSAVARALCTKMADTGMKLELILDKKNEQGSIDRMLPAYVGGAEITSANRAKALAGRERAIKRAEKSVIKLAKIENRTQSQNDKLNKTKKKMEKLLTKSEYLGSILCSSDNISTNQDYTIKRMTKQKGINWSHTKVFMVNPTDKEKITLAFSSANMSSGTTMHHENWHFVTASTESHFMQMHLCLKEAEFNYADSRKDFISYMSSCRKKIKLSEEDDIKTFFVPGEGEQAIAMFVKAIEKSENVDIAAHRYTLKPLIAALKTAKSKKTNVRMVFDDDLYLVGERRLARGLRVPNMGMEYGNLKKTIGRVDSILEKDYAEARYMQTNHYEHTIHHNKYIIMDNKKDKSMKAAVFCGAGNFTKAAFSKKGGSTNLENYYYITIPEVVEAFQKQYDYKWNNLATAYEDMPLVDLKPSRITK